MTLIFYQRLFLFLPHLFSSNFFLFFQNIFLLCDHDTKLCCQILIFYELLTLMLQESYENVPWIIFTGDKACLKIYKTKIHVTMKCMSFFIICWLFPLNGSLFVTFYKKCIAFDLWYILNGMVFEKYFSFSLFSSLLILEYNARLLTYMFYGKRDTWQRLFPSISRINLRKRNNLLTNFLCWRMIFS